MAYENVITACINGERERECDYCPASPNRNGSCCFGLRHEHGDPDCSACVLEDECAAIVHAPTQRPAPRVIYPAQKAASSVVAQRVRVATPGNPKLPIINQVGPQPGEPLLIPAPMTPAPVRLDPEDGLVKRFFKVGGWGALEGFFEMGTNFLRKRRPE